MRLINIGFGNIVFANRLIAIVSPESAPVKRLVQDARDRGMLIDATYGRRTRAVLITDSDHIILSAVQPETVANRLNTHDPDQIQSAHEQDEGPPEDFAGVRGYGAIAGNELDIPLPTDENHGEEHVDRHSGTRSGGERGGARSGSESGGARSGGGQKRRGS